MLCLCLCLLLLLLYMLQASAAAYPFKKKDARLVLQDGSVWHGTAFGAKGTEVGEVVFNTSITGNHGVAPMG
jgi:carbamoyl-phosphate synthase small subunit